MKTPTALLPLLAVPLLGSCVIAIGNEGKAYGGDYGDRKVRGALAVIHAADEGGARGVVRFTDEGDAVRVVADLEGLAPGRYTVAVHETGNVQELSAGVAGPVLRAWGDGDDDDDVRVYSNWNHRAALDAREAGGNGRLSVRAKLEDFALRGPNSLLGRGVVVHAGDDASGPVVAYGVIGASRD